MKKVTKGEPIIWEQRIVGFGNYHSKYVSGGEGYWLITGFHPGNKILQYSLLRNLKSLKNY